MKKYFNILFLVFLNTGFIFSQDVENLYKQANGYYKNLNFTEAEKLYKQIITLKPDYAQAYYGIGSVYYARKDYKNAIKYYSLATEKNKNFSQAYEWLGNCYVKTGESKEAIRYWKKSLEINPNNDNIKNNIKILSKEIETSEKNSDNILRKVNEFRKDYNYKEIEKILNKALKQNPDSVKLWFTLSRINFEQRKYKEVKSCWEKLVEKENSLIFSQLLYPGESIESYIEEVDYITTLFPKDISVLYYAGLVYYNSKEINTAINFFERYINLDKTPKINAYIYLSKLYVKNGDKEKASDIYDKLIINNDNIEVNYLAGNFYLYEVADIEKAKACLSKVKKVSPEYKNIKQIYAYLEKY